MRYTLLKKHKKQRTLNNLFIEWKAMKRWKHKVSIDQPPRLRNIDHTDQFSYSTQIFCLTFGSECSTIIRNSWKNRQCIHSTSSSVASVFSHSKKTLIVHIIVLDFQLLVETNINIACDQETLKQIWRYNYTNIIKTILSTCPRPNVQYQYPVNIIPDFFKKNLVTTSSCCPNRCEKGVNSLVSSIDQESAFIKKVWQC